MDDTQKLIETAAIERMSREDLRAIGARNSGGVAERYDWRHVFDRLFGIYREVIAGFRRD